MFRKIVRNNRLKKYSQPAIKGFTSLDNVKYMAVIIDTSDPGFIKCRDIVTRFCNDHGFALNLIYIDMRRNRRKIEIFTDEDVTVLRHDLNWFGKPCDRKVSLLRDNPCDLLVCLSGQESYSIEYLCGVAAAKFKIGRTSYDDNPFDIIVKEPASAGRDMQVNIFNAMIQLLEQVNR